MSLGGNTSGGSLFGFGSQQNQQNQQHQQHQQSFNNNMQQGGGPGQPNLMQKLGKSIKIISQWKVLNCFFL